MNDRLTCEHPRLHFGSGSYYVVCDACGQYWLKIAPGASEENGDTEGRNDLPNEERMYLPSTPDEPI